MRRPTVLLRVALAALLLGVLPSASGSDPYSRPPVWAQLDRASPLGRGLIICPAYNQGQSNTLWEPVSQQSATIFNNAMTWGTITDPNHTIQGWASTGYTGTGSGPGTSINTSGINWFKNPPPTGGGFTVAWYVRFETVTATSARRLGDTDHTSQAVVYESIAGQGGKWTYNYKDQGVSPGTVKSFNIAYSINTWHFIVASCKDGEVHVYADGNEVAGSPQTNLGLLNTYQSAQPNATVFMFTESTGTAVSASVSFQGQHAGAWFWSRALDKGEVMQFYSQPWGMFKW